MHLSKELQNATTTHESGESRVPREVSDSFAKPYPIYKGIKSVIGWFAFVSGSARAVLVFVSAW